MKKIIFIFTIIILILLAACSDNPVGVNSNSNTSSNINKTETNSVAERENDKSLDDEIDETGTRDEARAAALEYVRGNYAGWNVKGTLTRRTYDKFFVIVVDLEKAKENKTVELIARRFFPDQGKPYWKIEPYTMSQMRLKTQFKTQMIECENRWDNMTVDDVPDEVKDQIVSESEEKHTEQDYEPDYSDPRS